MARDRPRVDQVVHTPRSRLVALLWLGGHVPTAALLAAIADLPTLTEEKYRLTEGSGSLVKRER